MVTAVVSLTAGTMFLMWLGEQITERGIGNGVSLIIFAGIVAGLTGLKLQKEWVSAQDERTRQSPPDEFDHVEADGQVVGMKDAFTVGGEQLMFPGDPGASAGNLINCRCSVVYLTE